MDRIYLDYAATTPLNPKVLEAMAPYFSEKFGNPSSIHWLGQEASAAVFNARKMIADAIGADYREVVFTGSATEANNLALRGIFNMSLRGVPTAVVDDAAISKVARAKPEAISWDCFAPPPRGGGARNDKRPRGDRPKIITTSIEHDSIYETCKDLEKQGVEVTYLPVDKEGFVDLKALKAALDERTVLVSVGYANGEIGVVQNIKKIADEIASFRSAKLAMTDVDEIASSRLRSGLAMTDRTASSLRAAAKQSLRHCEPQAKQSFYPLFHIDAVQAFQFLKCDVNELGVDLMTLSAHKIYGPKGVGALFVRNQKSKIKNQNLGIPTAVGMDLTTAIITSLIIGGNQEWGLRAGTENVAGIVGFAKAVELAEKNRAKEAERQAELRNFLWRELKKMMPEIKLNGPEIDGEIAAPRSRSGLAMTDDEIAAFATSSGLAMTDEASSSLRAAAKQSILLTNNRLPNNLNIYFPNRSAQDLTIELDLLGVAVSPGTACSARSANPSRVIMALGSKPASAKAPAGKPDRSRSSVRLTLGRPTTKEEIIQVVRAFRKLDL